MNTTSLEISKELYEVSGWEDNIDTWFVPYKTEVSGNEVVKYKESLVAITHLPSGAYYDTFKCYPAYDLGYLLRKLPHEVTSEDEWGDEVTGSLGFWKSKNQYTCGYIDGENGFIELVETEEDGYKQRTEAEENADIPEDAAAKLAIELFKQGVLTK